jgi:hypothetical protein
LAAIGLGPSAHRERLHLALGSFEEQCSYLFGIGIPAAFLPSTREFGRTDLD